MKTTQYSKVNTLAAAAILILSAFASAQSVASGENSKLSPKDRMFIKEAGEGGLAEVQMGQLGKNTSSNPDVKSLAEMLERDHTKANIELEKIAKAKGGSVPKNPSAKQQSMLKMLALKKGPDFDQAFATAAVKDHKEDIAMFEKASKNLDDPDLKAFAEKTTPTLKEHLSMAEKAEGSKSKKD